MKDALSGQAAAEIAAKAGIRPTPTFILTFESEQEAVKYRPLVKNTSTPFQVEIKGEMVWCRYIP